MTLLKKKKTKLSKNIDEESIFIKEDQKKKIPLLTFLQQAITVISTNLLTYLCFVTEPRDTLPKPRLHISKNHQLIRVPILSFIPNKDLNSKVAIKILNKKNETIIKKAWIHTSPTHDLSLKTPFDKLENHNIEVHENDIKKINYSKQTYLIAIPWKKTDTIYKNTRKKIYEISF